MKLSDVECYASNLSSLETGIHVFDMEMLMMDDVFYEICETVEINGNDTLYGLLNGVRGPSKKVRWKLPVSSPEYDFLQCNN